MTKIQTHCKKCKKEIEVTRIQTGDGKYAYFLTGCDCAKNKNKQGVK